MFFFTYVPQAALLAFTNGPLAPFAAFMLVLSESSTILNALARRFLLRDALIDTFDGALVARGNTELVAQGRQIKSANEQDPISRLGDKIRNPLAEVSMASLLKPLVYLPLNFIPVVGGFMYVAGQGKRIGPICHERYFQLKGWDSKQKDDWVKTHRAAYMRYGRSFVTFVFPHFTQTYVNTPVG